jgi:hypothetical protein
MFALGIKKESQILRDGKSSDLTVAEKKDIFEMARTITELWEDRRPEMIGRCKTSSIIRIIKNFSLDNDATKTMAEKVLGKPAAVTQYLGEICEIRAMTQDEEGHWVRMDSGYIRRAIYLQIEETGNLVRTLKKQPKVKECFRARSTAGAQISTRRQYTIINVIITICLNNCYCFYLD